MDYQAKAKQAVTAYFNSQVEITDSVAITTEDVYVVWFAKTLQNWKALLSTNIPDGMYYEVTYDGEKRCMYLDAYKKFKNVKISDEEWVKHTSVEKLTDYMNKR